MVICVGMMWMECGWWAVWWSICRRGSICGGGVAILLREWYVLRHGLGFGAGYGVDVEGVGRG